MEPETNEHMEVDFVLCAGVNRPFTTGTLDLLLFAVVVGIRDSGVTLLSPSIDGRRDLVIGCCCGCCRRTAGVGLARPLMLLLRS